MAAFAGSIIFTLLSEQGSQDGPLRINRQPTFATEARCDFDD